MATYKRKKINKGLIVLNRGERMAVISLLSLIAILLGFSLFRPVLPLNRKDRMAFHNLDSMLAAHALPVPAVTEEVEKTGPDERPVKQNSPPPKTVQGKGKENAAPSKPEAAAGAVARGGYTKPSPKVLPLNSADSTELIALPQIGEVMASRIHRYRERLGGYVSLDQLFEVKGMDSARFETVRPYLTLDTESLRRLNVNDDDFKTLLRHPYLEYEQVKAIVNHRERKGLIRDWEQLHAITGEVNPRLQAYVTY